MTTFTSVDDYIDSFPADVSAQLAQVRRTIKDVAPRTAETISYQMPTVTLDGTYLVYSAAWKHHLGLYPIPTMTDALGADGHRAHQPAGDRRLTASPRAP